MSFILDALKKSDAKRRAQLGPDLATPPPPTAASSNKHPKPMMVWGSVGLIGVLLIAGATFWFFSEQSALPDDVAGQNSPVTARTDAPEESMIEVEADLSAKAAEPINAMASLPVSEAPAAPAETGSEIVATVAIDDATSGNETEPVLPTPDPTTVEVLEARLAAVSEVQVPDETLDVSEQSAETTEAELVGYADEPAEAWKPQAADYLYEWELPLAVRQSLPTLNMLVHVYSEAPADRFVLINGTRYREGDELSSGVRLAEIRPEGALVDFRDYRFLLSQ